VSKASAPDGLFLTYAKEPSWLGVDAWSFTGIDATTGEVAWRRLAGTGPFVNNHYAALYVGPSGGVYVGTIAGIVALLPAAS
jgi:outer membrane protein assembly factor BamB